MTSHRHRHNRGRYKPPRPRHLDCGICGAPIYDIEFDAVVIGQEGGGIIDMVHRGVCLLVMKERLAAHGLRDGVERYERLDTFLDRVDPDA